jgi:hypothetical protein
MSWGTKVMLRVFPENTGNTLNSSLQQNTEFIVWGGWISMTDKGHCLHLVSPWWFPSSRGCLKPCNQEGWDNNVQHWNHKNNCFHQMPKRISLQNIFCFSLVSFLFFLLQEQQGRIKRHSSIFLSYVNKECNDSNSDLLTTWAAFFPPKVEGTSLHKSFENVSAITMRGPSI